MHVEKYTKNAVGHLLLHYGRWVAHFGNKDIDHLRSDFNYNLAPARGMGDFDYYQKRLSEVKCQNRADVKTLCDWIVTLPKENFSEEQERRFFQTAYDFMAKRYGEKNVVSAWVHKDEGGQPHLHFAFIPVCIDRKKGIEKVSAKEVLTRTDLQNIHPEMAACMERVFGRDIGILNGETAGGNKTVMELKAKELKQEVASLKELKEQSIVEVAQSIRKQPKLIEAITRAIRIALGKEKPPIIRDREHIREQSR